MSHKWFAVLSFVALVCGPFASMLGNAGSDIWLCLIVLAFLGKSVLDKEWGWVYEPWIILAFLFWFWMVFTSAISPWRMNSFEHSVPWVRFPLFAAAFAYFVSRSKNLHEGVMYGFLAGVIIMMIVLVIERINNPDAERLFGTWRQHLKAAWFMVGFGLPVSLWALGQLQKKTSSFKWVFPLVGLIVAITANTGEIYMTILLLFGIGLFIVFGGLGWKLSAGVAAFGIASIGVMFAFGRQTLERFQYGIESRLPWKETSDYYPAWMGGIEAGKLNPVTGIGPNNFEFVCKQEGGAELLQVPYCHVHPHQLYIQTFAETGLPGLILFVLVVFALFYKVARKYDLKGKLLSPGKNTDRLAQVQSLVLLTAALWPISTYSEAFGQHKNFFTWLAIGWALGLLQYSKKSRSGT